MTQRALITGVTGFLGSRLARSLNADGVEVHAIVRPASHLDRIPDLEGRVQFHVDDGSMGAVRDAFSAADPEVCFHLATHFVAEHNSDDVPALADANVAFGMRVAEAAAQVPRRVFVNAGTAWQHVDGEPYRPKGLYAATKQAFEDVLRYYADADQLHVVTLNLYDSYGPDDPRGKLVSALVNAARSGKHLDMTSGRQLIDLVHVDDVVRAFSHAFSLARGMPFCEARAFAVSSAQAVSLRELVSIVEAIVGHPLDVTWGAREDRANEMLTPWYAGDPLPGWSPRIKLVDGLRALLEEAPA